VCDVPGSSGSEGSEGRNYCEFIQVYRFKLYKPDKHRFIMDQVIPLKDSKNDVDIHKLCMYGHIQELRELLGVANPNAPVADKDSGDGSNPASPNESDEEADLDGGNSAMSPPNSPGPGSPTSVSPPDSPKGSPLNSPGRSGPALEHLDRRSVTGQTALTLSAMEGHLECLKLLLEQGADIGATSAGGMTALHAAANRYQEACIKELLDAGADSNAETDLGLTPIYFSICRGVLACVKLLVNAGADVSFKTKQGGSLIHVAVINGNVGLIKYLTEVSILLMI
jgi:hypothetical protein